LMDCAFSFLMFEESMAWTDGMVMEGRGRIEKRGERRGVLKEGGWIVFCGYRKNFFSAKTPGGVGSVSKVSLRLPSEELIGRMRFDGCWGRIRGFECLWWFEGIRVFCLNFLFWSLCLLSFFL
jgi:hypothetical protein